MRDPRCTICHEKPLFPVRFQCFPCSFFSTSREKRNCSTLTVVCMHCADRYLELDLPPSDRSLSKRCLFCDKTVDPLCLTKEIAYEVLHPLMDMDEEVYACPHIACPYKDTHLSLFDHTRKECIYRTVTCRECYQLYPIILEETHKSTHPCHSQCTVCLEWIPTRKFALHMEEEHAHYALCTVCDTYVPEYNFSAHMSTHPCHSQCTVCFEWIPTRKFTLHMEEEHAHYVLCMVCDTYVPEYNFSGHMREKHQGQECRYCGKWIWYITGEDGLYEEFLRHVNNDECQGTLECPLCDNGTMLKPKDILSHLKSHSNRVNLLVEKYKELLDVYREDTELIDKDYVLHTEWIRKILVEKNHESRTIYTFMKKHEKFWV